MTLRAVVFDLDGTLVDTETLKAAAYARAIQELRPDSFNVAEVGEAYQELVGRTREEVAKGMMQRFDVEETLQARLASFNAETALEAFLQLRQCYYDDLLGDAERLRALAYPHTLALLAEAHRNGCKAGLASMSTRAEPQQVLAALDLTHAFDFTASREDVVNGKPDPEIYRLAARQWSLSPQECLVIEDSPSGIQAALAAGMHCIAVTNAFTRTAVRTARLLDGCWVVDDPTALLQTFHQLVKEQGDPMTPGL
jgi:beta-phosphoglucomutase